MYSWQSWIERHCVLTWKLYSTAIIPHPHAIISNALGYILLIVDSSDPNLF